MKKLLLAAVFTIAGIANAFAGGVYAQYPQVGNTQSTTSPPGPAYSNTCTSFGNNNVCNQYQPFGPTAAPGTAYFPADTGLPGGQNPQTVTIPLALTGATVVDAAPLTGASITMGTGVVKLLLDPAGTIAALTVVTAPATALFDGQELQISSSQTVTALTLTAGTGTTIVPTITTVGSAAPVNLVYHAATAKWVGQ
jgi:hypothetical protein